MVDGYTTSDAHPYARAMEMPNGEPFNYIRNSVKATVDAYDGTTHFYVFDPSDPLIQAYRSLFPELFQPASAMPAGSARACALSGTAVPRAGRHVPLLSHAESAGVL